MYHYTLYNKKHVAVDDVAIFSNLPVVLQPTASEKVIATDRLVPGSDGTRDKPAKELHLQTKARHHTELRDELLGIKGTTCCLLPQEH